MAVSTVKNEPNSDSGEYDDVKNEDIEIVTNWKIVNDRLLHNTISTSDIDTSPKRANLEDVVSLETCIRLEGETNEKKEPCTIDIKLKNGQKIARIAIVSEASLIEFYKQFGEYVSTSHPEFIDEFENSAVYFADISFIPPTPEVGIKFARLKSPGSAMWLYGIRLCLAQPTPINKREPFDYHAIGEMLQSRTRPIEKPSNWAKEIMEKAVPSGDCEKPVLDSFLQNFVSMNIDSTKQKHLSTRRDHEKTRSDDCDNIGDSKDLHRSDFKNYIDNRLTDMEKRLTQKIDAISFKTNEKLDNIIRLLNNK
ncbi:uncharacterized protein LOC105691938 [Athalia rosae]|uniref:uncharacterized protein LOC105691938 n=1 Tax=Athalia rosae TaxID=37344 RepID=UPI002033E5BC|nr:uncharacterized protein LOC105691938 [Athalia rosae]XP_048508596.1 uncharacterized protein LOC105691938 [Athalia rosae]